MKNLILNEGYDNLNNLFTSGKGSNIFVNNKKYLDLSLCAGSHLLGHNPKIFKHSINKMLGLNVSNFAAKNKYTTEFTKTLKKVLPNYSKFIFCNSGTEAVMKSLRVARAVTQKEIIISVSGSWHGSTSELLYTNNKKLESIELSSGLDLNFKKNLKIIPYNNISLSKKILDKYKKKIMCVIIEPIQGCLPTESLDFLKFLDNYCKKNKLILIFDEMITGLRFNCSSVQDQFNLKPSISTFGKCFGGGLPIGIIAIKKDILKKMSKNKKKVFFGGTFSGNSISMYISNKVVTYIYKNKKLIFQDLDKKSEFIQKKINFFFNQHNIDATCLRFASMIRIVFTKKRIINRTQRDFFENKKKKVIDDFKNYLFKNKIYYPNSGIIFLATSTSYKEINHLLEITKKAFKKLYK
jgi:glutamate-1-semialdehyde 2,1-aminomutase|tara:strand:+ start:11419 stop:12645 length:1227 start_codon:yes stop_codon:yes gene_type:complete